MVKNKLALTPWKRLLGLKLRLKAEIKLWYIHIAAGEAVHASGVGVTEGKFYIATDACCPTCGQVRRVKVDFSQVEEIQ